MLWPDLGVSTLIILDSLLIPIACALFKKNVHCVQMGKQQQEFGI